MEHPYEYRVLTKYVSFKIKGVPNQEQEAKELALALGKFANGLPEMLATMPDSAGWEVNSHSCALLAGNTLMVCILLQRPRT